LGIYVYIYMIKMFVYDIMIDDDIKNIAGENNSFKFENVTKLRF